MERLAAVWRWLASRRPRAYLIAGWVLFVLTCYPGYLSFESEMQLFAVRTGVYTDHAPLMAILWSLLEWAFAGPFPMLVLQSGLFLFGTYALLSRALAPRVAAVSAAGLLLFPPVGAVLAVIWPDSLMAGALIASAACLLRPGWRWKAAGGALLVLACACRPAIVPALTPLVFLAIPAGPRWRRAAIALGAVVAIALVARLPDVTSVGDDQHHWQQDVLLPDIAGTLHRAHEKSEAKIRAAFDGLQLAPGDDLVKRVTGSREQLDSWGLLHGEHRITDPIATDELGDAVSRDWRRTVRAYPGAYLKHRWMMMRAQLGLLGAWSPVFHDFGDPEVLAPLHHRARASDVESAWQAFEDLLANTPLFRPWLYLLLAFAALALARRDQVLRALAISGVIYELALFFFAPAPEYRYSHWLVTTTSLVLIAVGLARKPAWRATSS